MVENISFSDDVIAEAMFFYAADSDITARARKEGLSVAEWILKNDLNGFNLYCIDNYGFKVKVEE